MTKVNISEHDRLKFLFAGLSNWIRDVDEPTDVWKYERMAGPNYRDACEWEVVLALCHHWGANDWRGWIKEHEDLLAAERSSS